MPGLVPGIHVFLALGSKNVDGRDQPGHDDLYCSHQHLAAGEGGGFRNDPSVEQIEIDIAAAQDEAYPLAPDFWLFLQGRGESRGAGTLGKIMRVCPIGSYRDAYLVAAALHDC